MDPAAEYLGSPDEVAGAPVGQRNLAAERRRVEHADAAALDQIDTVMFGALVEQRLAAIENLAASLLQDDFSFPRRELFHQRWRTADRLLAFAQQQGRAYCRRGGTSRRRRTIAGCTGHLLQHSRSPDHL